MMKKLILLFVCISTSIQFHAQKIHRYDNFSEKYTLYQLTPLNSDEDENTYLITDKKNENIVLRNGDPQAIEYIIQNKSKAIKSEYTNEHKVSITKDYNEDGIKDIFIEGSIVYDEGCYNPMSYCSIYLSTPKGFERNEQLSSLFNEAFCLRGGSAEYDEKRKVFVKEETGGAMYHSTTIYKLQSDTLSPIEYITEDGLNNQIYTEISSKKRKGDSWVKSGYKLLHLSNKDDLILSFDTENGKVILFQYGDILCYAFEEKDEKIYFAYPPSLEESATAKTRFKFKNEGRRYSLSFNSGTIRYIINESDEGMNITIVTKKDNVWTGKINTKKGSLKKLADKQFENMERMH